MFAPANVERFNRLPRLKKDRSVESPDSMRAGKIRCESPTAVTSTALTIRGSGVTWGAFYRVVVIKITTGMREK